MITHIDRPRSALTAALWAAVALVVTLIAVNLVDGDRPASRQTPPPAPTTTAIHTG